MHMAEDAGAADIIAGGRLQLGISRGSPEQVIDGWRHFGYAPRDGETAADMARRHAEVFLELLKGGGFAKPNPRPMFPNPPGLLRLEPYSEGLRERIWWGSSSNATSKWAAKLGMNLQTRRSKTMRPASRPTYSSGSRLKPIVRRGRRPAIGVSRASMSAAASSRSSTTATGRLWSRRPRPGPGRLHRREHEGHLRPLVRRGTRRAGQRTRGRRGYQGGRHVAARRSRTSWVWTTTPTRSTASGGYVAPELGWR